MGNPFCDLGIVTPCIAESFCKKSHLKTLKELRHDRPLSVRFPNGNYPFPNPWDQDASAFGYLRLCIYGYRTPSRIFSFRYVDLPSFRQVLLNCGIYFIYFCSVALLWAELLLSSVLAPGVTFVRLSSRRIHRYCFMGERLRSLPLSSLIYKFLPFVNSERGISPEKIFFEETPISV